MGHPPSQSAIAIISIPGSPTASLAATAWPSSPRDAHANAACVRTTPPVQTCCSVARDARFCHVERIDPHLYEGLDAFPLRAHDRLVIDVVTGVQHHPH